MSDDQTEDSRTLKSGKIVDVKGDQPAPSSASRKAKMFVPDQSEALHEVPESITAGERLPHVSEYSGIRLESLPVKGLKSFFYSFLVLLLATAGWEAWTVFRSAMELHWLLACSFVALLSVVVGLGARLVLRYLNNYENAGVLNDIRKQSARLLEGHDHGNAKRLITTLGDFYANKPQQIFLQACMDQLPDYSDDREAIEHIDRMFLRPLDKEVLRRISKFSSQTGLSVAASPWVSLDMALGLWRSMKMIDEIAQVYGLRPSLSNRFKLIKSVINQLAFIGVSELMLDQLTEDFGISTLSGMASVRIGQGVGAGVYSAKIGLAAMNVTRPIEFSDQEQPKLKSLVAPIVLSIRDMIKR